MVEFKGQGGSSCLAGVSGGGTRTNSAGQRELPEWGMSNSPLSAWGIPSPTSQIRPLKTFLNTATAIMEGQLFSNCRAVVRE